MSAAMIAALAGVAILTVAMAFLVARFAFRMPMPPAWTWDDLRKLVALLATIAAAGILTAWGWWQSDAQTASLVRIIDLLAAGKGETAKLGDIGMEIVTSEGAKGELLVGGLMLIILSLGLVIGPRMLRFKGPGGIDGELGGGSPDPAVRAAQRVAGAAADERREIESEAKE